MDENELMKEYHDILPDNLKGKTLTQIFENNAKDDKKLYQDIKCMKESFDLYKKNSSLLSMFMNTSVTKSDPEIVSMIKKLVEIRPQLNSKLNQYNLSKKIQEHLDAPKENSELIQQSIKYVKDTIKLITELEEYIPKKNEGNDEEKK